MTNATEAQSFKMGKLKAESYASLQEFADDIARNLIGTAEAGPGGAPGTQGVPGVKGEPGTPGSQVSLVTTDIPLGAGISDVTATENLEQTIVHLVNNVDASMTIGIRGINGAKVYLTGATPTANYKIRYTKIVITNPS